MNHHPDAKASQHCLVLAGGAFRVHLRCASVTAMLDAPLQVVCSRDAPRGATFVSVAVELLRDVEMR